MLFALEYCRGLNEVWTIFCNIFFPLNFNYLSLSFHFAKFRTSLFIKSPCGQSFYIANEESWICFQEALRQLPYIFELVGLNLQRSAVTDLLLCISWPWSVALCSDCLTSLYRLALICRALQGLPYLFESHWPWSVLLCNGCLTFLNWFALICSVM